MTTSHYAKCIELAYACAAMCERCATNCLTESDAGQMSKCIQLDRECAVFCRAAATSMAQNSAFAPRLGALCAEVCEACAEECEQHKDMEHCAQCARVCRDCASECRLIAKV